MDSCDFEFGDYVEDDYMVCVPEAGYGIDLTPTPRQKYNLGFTAKGTVVANLQGSAKARIMLAEIKSTALGNVFANLVCSAQADLPRHPFWDLVDEVEEIERFDID
jgi:hypothetical protein